MADITSIAISVGFMAALGLILATVLVLANKRLYIYEDPRIDEVEDLLPRANCGACGTPGCRPFAEGLIEGSYEPAQCTVNSLNLNKIIADYLGVGMGTQEKRVARLVCAGGSHVAYIRASYSGLSSCRAAALVSGGGKGCTWGCLGMADCADVCDFDAITMDLHGLPVVNEEKCTACNDCVEVCPKALFELHPVSQQLFVACKNLEKGDQAEAECEVICTACERCVIDSPEGLIEITNNLAVIDYSKNKLASRVAIERCPTGAIVWYDKKGDYTVGKDTKKIIRKEALPVSS
ncbi:(Fe-S)-binding protein [Candidatus Vondammii sp. HM_W22]|uniref:(Fe-S)-binding protein n=1 Tax=Candidatus Vondammii sp. HM_W22 TaxID=2687299 RepID=UPI001F14754F|nr:RnfABCDGE type electron transport complex subunit B [Candidatus Vondammii sp. HM_W22]